MDQVGPLHDGPLEREGSRSRKMNTGKTSDNTPESSSEFAFETQHQRRNRGPGAGKAAVSRTDQKI
jgi:hypothetical protein